MPEMTQARLEERLKDLEQSKDHASDALTELHFSQKKNSEELEDMKARLVELELKRPRAFQTKLTVTSLVCAVGAILGAIFLALS